MQITMPQLGETIIEGTILRWLKAEGDTVALDEPLFEISTDKVDTEVPAPAAGTLTRILVAEGQTVAVGTQLAELATGDSDGGAEVASGAAPTGVDGLAAAGTESAAPPPPAVADASPAAPPPVPQPPEIAAPAVAAQAHPAIAPSADAGPRSGVLSPVVRRLAQEHDVDLSQVRGTGTGGRITRSDVEASIASAGATSSTAPSTAPTAATPVGQPAVHPSPAAPTTPLAAGDEVVPLTHLRRAIGEHMVASLQTSARAWTMVEIDMENVVRLRAAVKESFSAREGFGLTYMPFVARAVTEALLAFPAVNAELHGEELTMHRSVNLGIAVSIEGGLIVPVVKGADAMSVIGLARSIHDLAERARSQQLLPDEVHESTFTITNPGPFGSVLSLPIINQPNAGILSFDAIQQRPVVIDDAIAIRHMVYLSMSWDHRVIDGALATQFLAKIKEFLETRDFAEDLAP